MGGLLGIGLGILGDWRSGLPVWESFDLGLLRDLLMMCLVLLVMTRVGRAPVTLTSYGVTVRSWRTRTVGWPDIAGVMVTCDFPGFRYVRLTTLSGQRISLPTPLSLLDPRFTAKADAIRAHWTARRPFWPDITGPLAPAPWTGPSPNPG